MTTILKTGVKSYFINIDGSISMEYDPMYNRCFEFEVDGNKVNVSSSDIIIQTGGQITFNYDNKKYIIDDGYRDTLISAGYLCLNVDKEPDDIEVQKEIRSTLIDMLKYIGFNNIVDEPNHLVVYYNALDYKFTIDIESINKMIEQNLKRKELNLPMYPTIRDVSKTTSLYYRIFAKKTHSAKVNRNSTELLATSKKILKMIAESPELDWCNISNILGVTKEYKLEVKECVFKGIILRWEDNL